eukprot:Skav208647  [mRNA]  locus=scaffold1081:232968:234233:- [translate_table: standard]
MEPPVPQHCGVGKGSRICLGEVSRCADGSLKCSAAQHHRAFQVQKESGVEWAWATRGVAELKSKGLQVVGKQPRPVATPQKRTVSEAGAAKSWTQDSSARRSKASRTETVPPVEDEQQIVQSLTHVLLLKERWLEKILDGSKCLELRSQHTTKRGRIGLGLKDQIMGYCDLTDSQRLTCADVFARQQEHLCPLELVTYSAVYGWSLKSAKRLSVPAPLSRKLGQVVWVLVDQPVETKLEADVVQDIKAPAASSSSPEPVPIPEAIPQTDSCLEDSAEGCSRLAVKLAQANASKLVKLKKIAEKFQEQGRKTARGNVPEATAACLLCKRARHSCKWETRKLVQKDKEALIHTKGGCCYSCVRSCALMRCSRSVLALKEAGLVDVIAELSKAVAEAQNPDLCTCSKAACVEKLKAFKESAGEH